MEFFKQAPFIISTLSFILAAATFWRASKWRDSEEVKGIENNIEGLKTRVAVIENDQKNISKTDIDGLKSRVAVVENNQQNIATKEDIKRLESEVRAQEKLSKAQNEGLMSAISSLAAQVASLNKFLLENK